MQRIIKPELVAMIDAKIGNLSEDPIMAMRQALMALVGVHEESPNHGAAVELLQSTVGSPVGQAWCMDFIQSAIAYVEHKTGLLCLLPATESTAFMSNWARSSNLLSQNAMSDSLILWRHPNGGGHVGFVLEVKSITVRTVEGNTSMVSKEVVREGDEVAMKERSRLSTASMIVVGYLPVSFYSGAHAQ